MAGRNIKDRLIITIFNRAYFLIYTPAISGPDFRNGNFISIFYAVQTPA